MAYISYAEFEEIAGDGKVEEEKFNLYIKNASAVLDNITNSFYQFNDITKDYKFRSSRFKEALSAQILYFNELGGDTYESINKSPQSFSIGRTSVSNGSRYNAGGENESKNLVPNEVYIYLEGTGLLFRGTESGCVW